MNTKRANSWK